MINIVLFMIKVEVPKEVSLKPRSRCGTNHFENKKN